MLLKIVIFCQNNPQKRYRLGIENVLLKGLSNCVCKLLVKSMGTKHSNLHKKYDIQTYSKSSTQPTSKDIKHCKNKLRKKQLDLRILQIIYQFCNKDIVSRVL